MKWRSRHASSRRQGIGCGSYRGPLKNLSFAVKRALMRVKKSANNPPQLVESVTIHTRIEIGTVEEVEVL